MVLAPFLVVLGGRDDGGSGIGWRWRRCRWIGVWVRSCRGRVVGGALEDRHQTGDDDEEGPAVGPGEDAEGVQKKEDADENDPDGTAEGAKEPELVAGGAIVGYA